MFANRTFFHSFGQCLISGFVVGVVLMAPAFGQTPKSTAKPKSEPAAHFRPSDLKSPKLAKLEALLRQNAVTRVTPEYPPLPKNQRLSGDVKVEVTIDHGGQVIAARQLKGHPKLYEAAESAARKWRFRPLKEFSEPVDDTKPLVGVLTFRFTL